MAANRITITAWGETMNLNEWAKDPRCRVSLRVLRNRVHLEDWTPEQKIGRPPMSRTESGRKASLASPWRNTNPYYFGRRP